MSDPLSAQEFASALKKAGLGVVEHGTWRSHNRNHKGPWGPAHGVMVHHTGAYSSQADMVDICRTGYGDLPGPLCHGVIDRSGTVHLIGYGRTNHAGLGDSEVLNAVIAEQRELPTDDSKDVDGNRVFYGFECINTGTGQSWPQAQLESMAAAAAAICRAHGWNEHSVLGHKEWQPGKPDPAGIDMDDFRARVARHLKPDKPNDPKPGGGKPDKDNPEPQYAPFPGAGYFTTGRSSPLVSVMGKRLVAEDCNTYPRPPGPAWNAAHRRSYAAWQLKCGYRGRDADGIPGHASWNKLRVPNVAAEPDDNDDTDKDTSVPLPQSLADIAERTAMTYAQSFLGLLLTSSLTGLLDIDTWTSAAVSAVPAALSALKGTLGTVLGRSGTGSWLPADRDPASRRG